MKEGEQSTRGLGFFVHWLLVIAVTGTAIVRSAQERQMRAVGFTLS